MTNTQKLYGLTGTVILSLTVLFVFLFSQVLGVLLFTPFFLPNGANLSLDNQILQGTQNGTIISLTALVTLLCVWLCIFFTIKFKKGNVKQFLAIKGFGFKDFLGFGVALILLNVVINGITVWLDREPMLFMDELAISANPLWLLIVAIVVIVPIYEELIFRGFIWSGLASSTLGVWGASVITSILFGLVHMQYEAVEMVMIFALAMLFSYARIRTGSLLLPIMLHMMNNGLAMAQYLGV
nr:CPBP family intramembrane glutamic endopeptidase [uncultured Moraxella sp.]